MNYDSMSVDTLRTLYNWRIIQATRENTNDDVDVTLMALWAALRKAVLKEATVGKFVLTYTPHVQMLKATRNLQTALDLQEGQLSGDLPEDYHWNGLDEAMKTLFPEGEYGLYVIELKESKPLDRIELLMERVKAGDDVMEESYKTQVKETVGDVTIDTIDTCDSGWESALKEKDGGITILERYKTKEEAMNGQAKWVQYAKDGTLNDHITDDE